MSFFTIIFLGVIATSLAASLTSDSSSYETDTYDSYYDYDYGSGDIDERVTGGSSMDNTQLKKFKYQVGMLSNNGPIIGETICGGMLIHPIIVLTDAHCVQDTIYLGVFMGTIVSPSDINSCSNYIVNRRDIVIHSGYSKNSWNHEDDIAIVKLPREVTLNDYVGTIRLARNSDVCEGFGWVAGWGKYINMQISRTLKYARVATIPSDTCRRQYFGNLVANKQFCAAGTGTVGHCGGDSGGAYAFEDNNGRYACGLVAFHYQRSQWEDCETDYARGYTSIAYYHENGWICTASDRLVGC